MAVHVYMHAVAITGRYDGMPVQTVYPGVDITHCLTSVSDIDEQLALSGSFVMPDFEFKVDNINNAEYFPNYPECKNFQAYYEKYIIGIGESVTASRVYVDVRYITATNNKSLFFGALNSLVPSIDYKSAELSFTATQVMAKAMTDMSMEQVINKVAPYSVVSDLQKTTYNIRLWDMIPAFFWGYNQRAAMRTISVINSEAVASGLTVTMIRVPVKNVMEYRSVLEFVGDMLRAMSCYYVWEDNQFNIYDIKSIWSANASISLDEYLLDITKSEAWDEAVDDVVIEAGDNKYSSYDVFDNTYYERRPFTTNGPVSYRRASEMIRSRAIRGNTKVIDAPMLNYFYAPGQYLPPDGSGRRPYTTYGTGLALAINFMAGKMWLNNREFWATHKTQLDCEVTGLDWYYGRTYTINGTAYRCISTSKNLEMETTKLKLVA